MAGVPKWMQTVQEIRTSARGLMQSPLWRFHGDSQRVYGVSRVGQMGEKLFSDKEDALKYARKMVAKGHEMTVMRHTRSVDGKHLYTSGITWDSRRHT